MIYQVVELKEKTTVYFEAQSVANVCQKRLLHSHLTRCPVRPWCAAAETSPGVQRRKRVRPALAGEPPRLRKSPLRFQSLSIALPLFSFLGVLKKIFFSTPQRLIREGLGGPAGLADREGQPAQPRAALPASMGA